MIHRFYIPLALLLSVSATTRAEEDAPLFHRHVEAVFSRLGCNAGTCHGAVQGQGGFRLSLFAADPALDHERLRRDGSGRRINLTNPDASLLLLKATARVPHEGGQRLKPGSKEHELLRRWIAGGAKLEAPETSRVKALRVTPTEKTLKPGERYALRVEATYTDGATEDVTALSSYESLDRATATVDVDGQVTARGVGDAALLVRYRAEPAVVLVAVPRQSSEAFPQIAGHNFIDTHILAKLKKLNVPPAVLADDATFLRRVFLDVTGELPTPAEVRAFLADTAADKRTKKIDELLKRPGHAALWTLKFCDLLKASDFGVYADNIQENTDAPRFQEWVRARLEENTPYDQFVERILTATSREGRSIEEWAKETVALHEGYTTPRTDLAVYRQRKTLDLYWQRQSATGVPGAMQVAHAFLGLRLECAQCHRHPHDVWQQDDFLSFANFFMRVRPSGFQGGNEKAFPEVAAFTKKYGEEAKALTEQIKKMRDTRGKEFDSALKQAQAGGKKDQIEAAKKALDAFQKEVGELDKRSKALPLIAQRMNHSEIQHLADPAPRHASVTSPLGTQSSKEYRLLGDAKPVTVTADKDPRPLVVAWMKRPDNPYFARAIVNRVWAHYFGRGIVDPPDNLSPFNPATHPELLRELCQQFVKNNYDLRWLHRTILSSRTYQQSNKASPANVSDRANYAYFYLRRLPAEVLLDALNQATGTTENFDMKYYHWPETMKIVEIPYKPRNDFVVFLLEQFGRPARNSASQCDCERDPGVSILQVLTIANHPRVWQKISDPKGLATRLVKEKPDAASRIDELYLVALSRLPDEGEKKACLAYLEKEPMPEKGLQGLLWGLINTREFLIQH